MGSIRLGPDLDEDEIREAAWHAYLDEHGDPKPPPPVVASFIGDSLHCVCLEEITAEHLWRGWHGCGRTLLVVVGVPPVSQVTDTTE